MKFFKTVIMPLLPRESKVSFDHEGVKERIVTFARRWRGRVILDATGIGDPIYDDLKRVLPDIEPFKLTPGSKTDLVQRLIVAVEQRQVCWPAVSSQLDGRTVGQSGSGALVLPDRRTVRLECDDGRDEAL